MGISELASNPLFNLFNGLVGFVGVALAVYFYFKAKERYTLSYKIAERQLIQASSLRPFDMDVPLSWGGHDVTRLTRSFILIENSGNKLIERSDLASPPSIQVLQDDKIIHAELIFSDDPGSQIVIDVGTNNSRSLGFEFIRPADACVIKVDHTGQLNEVFVECRTKAGGAIKKINDGPRVAIGLLMAFPVLWLVGYTVSEYVDFLLPEPFDRASISRYGGGWIQLYVSFVVGAVASFAALMGYVILALAVRFATKRTLVPQKRAANMFNLIGLNIKRALD
jgi:hypothetical protein